MKVQKSRKYIALCLCIALIGSTPAMVLAEGNVSSSQTAAFRQAITGESTKFTQEDYVEKLNSVQSLSVEEESKIEAVCETFLTLARASVRDQSAYSPASLVSQSAKARNSQSKVAYTLSQYEYLAAVQDALNWVITSDDIAFSQVHVEVNDNHATASLLETYTYYMDAGFEDDYNYHAEEYEFSLEKVNGEWIITDVVPSSTKTKEDFDYTPIDVSAKVQQIAVAKIQAKRQPVITKEELLQRKLANSPQLQSTTAWNIWNYDTSTAVSYAQQFVKGVNPTFGASKEDCQNFSSQCVWAGLAGASSWPYLNYYNLPAMSYNPAGKSLEQSAPNVWARNEYSTYYSDYRLNWAWDNVQGFANLIWKSGPNVRGVCGDLLSTLSNAHTGDVIAWTDSGAAKISQLTHAMFVTEATGTVGQRTRYNIKIAAHTNATETAYEPLVNYDQGRSDSQYYTSVIYYGLY